MLRGAPQGTPPCCHHPLARHGLPSCVCAVLRIWVTLPSRDYSLDYLEFRLWIGLWVAFFGLVLVATEASHLVQYFTRFTEEGFCALISLIFIYDSLKKMLGLAEAFPINWHYRTDDVTLYSCFCNLSSPGKPRLPAAAPGPCTAPRLAAWGGCGAVPRWWAVHWLCTRGCTFTGTSRHWQGPSPVASMFSAVDWSPPACLRAGTREAMKVGTTGVPVPGTTERSPALSRPCLSRG